MSANPGSEPEVPRAKDASPGAGRHAEASVAIPTFPGPKESPVIRTFIAVSPPREVRLEVEEGIRKVRAFASDAKWVSSDNFHFTLRFLGNIEEERLDLLAECVAKSVRGEAPFEVTLSGLGAFPSVMKPRVLWVGTGQGADRLSGLARLVEAGLRKKGFGKADKAFAPHLTVARWRRPQRSPKFAEFMESQSLEAGPFRVEAVHVMESKLRPQGPVYSSRADCRLSG
jgi:2'-5' RNA ligase